MNRKPFVHPSSFVDDNVSIGDGTRIWHFCHVMKDAVIGKDCNIGQNVFIDAGVRIGNGVKIQNNVSVYRGVTLEDHVFCGPSCVFTNVINPRSAFPREAEEYKKTTVGEGASIGANGTVVCGNDIGRHAFIGAGSVVTKDVPDHALVYGNPARLHGWICVCGEKLPLSRDKTLGCARCRKRYVRKGTSVFMAKEG